MRGPFAVVTTLFFLWGFITVMVDALVPRLKAVFELSYFEAALVQFAFFAAYLLLSIPSGVLIARVGYKRGVVVGLLAMGVGCLLFVPAAGLRVYALFLLAMFVLAGGITVLQVAANPYVAALGPARTASSRLNLAQAFNSLGTTIAPLVGAAFILGNTVLSSGEIAGLGEAERAAYYAAEAGTVQTPFVVLAAVLAVLAVAFGVFNLPKILETDDHASGSYRGALASKALVWGAVGIFLYVGAEVTIGSYLVNYFLALDVAALVADTPWLAGIAGFLSGGDYETFNVERLAGTFVALYWGGAMVGRFVGAALLQTVSPGRLLTVFSGVAIVLLAVSAASGGVLAMAAILAVGLVNSIQFATIFTLAIDGLGPHTAQGSGVLCTAIVGGAVVPPLYGALADAVGVQPAFLLLTLCYGTIAAYGLSRARATPEVPDPEAPLSAVTV
ncbi:sugar MFS transporter [Rubrivirga marina]|uniref:Glucose/galactose MFS transporter n=1 Tax=Rubrivirga marina TaxID=1196024 RepID=A0A271J5P7_9BACT|nr:sugar MFS transporter [Rubrivirga marina]PAP78670.1 glucose/galactose MFS transporter [Rubrivirga marina]